MTTPAQPAASADYSRFVQRVRRRYGAERALLDGGTPDAASIAALVDRLRHDGRPLASALRVARQLVLERLVVRDVEERAALAEVTAAMTALAEVTLDFALAQARADEDARSGVPRDAAGRKIELWIVGMGKLGARELNVSSDIDLIYVYDDDGQTDGVRPISAQEYFAAVSRRLYTLVGDTTEDGFVFRLDLALRPNGKSGPPAVSLPMLEEYFLVQGREWERFAWLKSRVVAPAAAAAGRTPSLHALVNAFVYRRYLDYGVFEGLRELHRRIREDAQRRAAGRPARANDVKISRGGIREIEFIVQLLQVVRGGQTPEIRSRSTLGALERLGARGLIGRDTACRLAEAYVFLRRLEHRIQYLDDQQTHLLPENDADLNWIAAAMGLSACRPDACELLDRLGELRELVATEFDALLHDATRGSSGTVDCRRCGAPAPALDSDQLVEALPEPLATRVREWIPQPRVARASETSRQRLATLVQRAARAIAAGQCTIESALRFVDWLDPLLRRDSYLALLIERPDVMIRLLRMLGLARWPMRYLMRHPGVVDELADPRALLERFEPAAYRAALEERHRAWERTGEADEGALLDTLRHAHHAEVFGILARDVEGLTSVEEVADDLSALADATIDCTIAWAWSRLRQRHRDQPRFAVIAYGKLGGKELGYGSDLDVVFLYDDADEPDPDQAQETYGRFVRKLITWLTLRTSAGELFDIDTALRPNGNSGLLVTSIASFERYQEGRGGNTAWTWEHQALTRARFCAGAADLGPRFEAVRRDVLAAPRDHAALAAEVVAMRDRLRRSRPVNPERFDLKHSPGGMIDVEFAVQFLVLAHGAKHPELLDNRGNIALLERAETAGLLGAGVGHAAADAYRELRRAQHRARLDEQPTQIEPAMLVREREAVLALWHSVFG